MGHNRGSGYEQTLTGIAHNAVLRLEESLEVPEGDAGDSGSYWKTVIRPYAELDLREVSSPHVTGMFNLEERQAAPVESGYVAVVFAIEDEPGIEASGSTAAAQLTRLLLNQADSSLIKP